MALPRKLILCRCEDVTSTDVERAVSEGHADLEEVKRYTGFGTGPCQGKECLRSVALAIAAASGAPTAALRPFTARPPLAPSELKWFAATAARGVPAATATTKTATATVTDSGASKLRASAPDGREPER